MKPAAEPARPPADDFTRAGEAADFLRSRTKLRPKIALVLGSGLGSFADQFAAAVSIPYADIPHFLVPRWWRRLSPGLGSSVSKKTIRTGLFSRVGWAMSSSELRSRERRTRGTTQCLIWRVNEINQKIDGIG